MCTRQSRNLIWDMFNTLFLTLYLSNLFLLLSFSTHRNMSMASPAILSNFFERRWTQNHPQYLSGLSRALYPTTFLEIAVNAARISNQEVADSRVLRNSITSLSIFPFQACPERIIDFLSAHKILMKFGMTAIYFISLHGCYAARTGNCQKKAKQRNFPTSRDLRRSQD